MPNLFTHFNKSYHKQSALFPCFWCFGMVIKLVFMCFLIASAFYFGINQHLLYIVSPLQIHSVYPAYT